MDNIEINTNNTNFLLFLKKFIETLGEEYLEKSKKDNMVSVDNLSKNLRYHQYISYNFFNYFHFLNNHSESMGRGLLIKHDPGTGKSILIAAITEYFRKYDPNRKIVIMLSKSIQKNIEINISKYISMSKKWGGFDNYNIIDKYYNFISLNSSTVMEQIYNLNPDKRKDQVLENSLVVIDEFHNLSNSITNHSKNALLLYELFMSTKNIKFLFATGTPIINHPFELVPTFNILMGKELFPENPIHFNNYFVDSKNHKIKNKNKFQNRINGMISYYGDEYFDKENREGYPSQKPIKIEKISMSIEQFGRYKEARDLEKREESSRIKKGEKNVGFKIQDSSLKITSSYRIRTRQISNYYIPEYALKFSRGRTKVEKFPQQITKQDIKNLDIFSPKFKRILSNIKKYYISASTNKLGVVYSEFVSGEGLSLFSRVLEEVENYSIWNNISLDREFQEELVLSNPFAENDKPIRGGNKSIAENDKISKSHRTPRTYAIISGDIPFYERENIIKTFNSKENINGKLISLLLISKTGAEGLSLHNVRHIHIMEPFWNYARIEQVIARGVRYLSHKDLPKKEQDIRPYIYLSVIPNLIGESSNQEKTTDEYIFINSINNKRLIDSFNKVLIESSIDCFAHIEDANKIRKKNNQEIINCKICAPTDSILYYEDLDKDIELSDNCKKLEERKIKVEEIYIPELDEKYYYTDKNEGVDRDIKIFTYDPNLKGYKTLSYKNPIYQTIIKSII